jgi:hypothetical protein
VTDAFACRCPGRHHDIANLARFNFLDLDVVLRRLVPVQPALPQEVKNSRYSGA